MSKRIFIAASVLFAGSLFAAVPNEVNRRAENQQDRVSQGVRSGSLTARETGRLESRDAAIHQETRADRRANGGYLTNSEKRQVNRQDNRVSRSIYRDKHNQFRQ